MLKKNVFFTFAVWFSMVTMTRENVVDVMGTCCTVSSRRPRLGVNPSAFEWCVNIWHRISSLIMLTNISLRLSSVEIRVESRTHHVYNFHLLHLTPMCFCVWLTMCDGDGICQPKHTPFTLLVCLVHLSSSGTPNMLTEHHHK